MPGAHRLRPLRQLIAEGRDREAYLTARSPNPLASVCGRICAAPCESKSAWPASTSALALTACGGGALEPVPIVLDEDACSSCRMAISQPEYAAELVTPTGRGERFDDLGCVAAWLRRQEV